MAHQISIQEKGNLRTSKTLALAVAVCGRLARGGLRELASPGRNQDRLKLTAYGHAARRLTWRPRRRITRNLPAGRGGCRSFAADEEVVVSAQARGRFAESTSISASYVSQGQVHRDD